MRHGSSLAREQQPSEALAAYQFCQVLELVVLKGLVEDRDIERQHFMKRRERLLGPWTLASDRIAKPGVEGVRVTNTYIFWVEDDRLFEIAAFKEGADPLQDPVIKEFVDSIKFLSKSPR